MTANRDAIHLRILGAVLWILASVVTPAVAEEAEPDSSSNGWSVFPAGYYTDETKLAGGVYAVYDYGDLGSGHSSTIAANFIYTTKNQVLAGMIADVSGDRYRLFGLVFGKKFPSTFYGIGRDTRDADAQEYTDRSLSILAIPQRKVRPNLYLGPMVWFQARALSNPDAGSELARGTLPGSGGDLSILGLGGVCTWDTRDHNAYPTTGAYYEFWAAGYSKSFGSDREFRILELDLQHYLPLAERRTLAVQVLLNSVSRGAPFQSYPELGDNNLRGFASRYVDRSMLVLHAGYRHRFSNRWGFALFAGVGDVAPEVSDLRLSEVKFGAGLGIRFLLIPDARLNLRFDLGFGTGGNTSSEFLPGEAF